MKSSSPAHWSALISAGALAPGAANSVVTIPAPIKSFSTVAWTIPPFRNSSSSTFCTTKCCTSSIPPAARAARSSHTRRNFAPKKNSFPNSTAPAAFSTAWPAKPQCSLGLSLTRLLCFPPQLLYLLFDLLFVFRVRIELQIPRVRLQRVSLPAFFLLCLAQV